MSRAIASRRVHTGTFAGDQMQRTAQQAARAANELDGRLVDVEYDKPIVRTLLKDFTTTAATAQDTLLSIPVEDGDFWMVEYWGHAGCSGSANGMKYAVKAPAASTISGVLDSSLTTAIDDSHQQITVVNTLTTAVHTVNGGVRDDYMNVRLKVVGAGVITLQACSTTAGNTTTIAALATMRATRFRLVQ